jgi:hypothetical protein
VAWLTKSKFLSGLQCAKRLWFEVHEPLKEETRISLALINGRTVDRIAQALIPGTVISRDGGVAAAIAKTSELVNTGAPFVLYQPAFKAGDLTVIADMVQTDEHGVTLTEVKSSTSVKPEHVADIAFQTLVIRKAGLLVDRTLLAHVDRSFELKRAGDYNGLLVEKDLTSEVESSLPEIEKSSAKLQGVMAMQARPEISMGAQCNVPYECPFVDRCLREMGPRPEFPVGLLPRGGKIVRALQEAGYDDLVTVPVERLSRELHQRVHHATVTGEAYFDASATAELRKQTYPMTYLDFETITLAVPEIVGSHPYDQWPFQWSVHVEEFGGQVRHAEYLAIESFDDLNPLAQALLSAVPDSGPIFAYSASFERAVLQFVADRVPSLANALRALAERLVDLLAITRAAYYHRDMKGSWSIKAVLPTIDPGLSYSELGEIAEGGAAQLAFLRARDPRTSRERRRELLDGLKVYCERDTWGMVVLRRFLSTEPRGVQKDCLR